MINKLVYDTSWAEQVSQDTSGIAMVMEGLRKSLLFSGLTPGYAYFGSVALGWTILQRLEAQLCFAANVLASDVSVVKRVCRGVARMAADCVSCKICPITTTDCQKLAKLISGLGTAAEQHLGSDDLPPHVVPLSALPQAALEHPLFGRLRRDTSVDGLIGQESIPAIGEYTTRMCTS
jgi:hypothetical protein